MSAMDAKDYPTPSAQIHGVFLYIATNATVNERAARSKVYCGPQPCRPGQQGTRTLCCCYEHPEAMVRVSHLDYQWLAQPPQPRSYPPTACRRVVLNLIHVLAHSVPLPTPSLPAPGPPPYLQEPERARLHRVALSLLAASSLVPPAPHYLRALSTVCTISIQPLYDLHTHALRPLEQETGTHPERAHPKVHSLRRAHRDGACLKEHRAAIR